MSLVKLIKKSSDSGWLYVNKIYLYFCLNLFKMKHLYLFLLAIFISDAIPAQNLNGRTIRIVGDSANIMETGVVRVNNKTSQNISMKVRRREGNLVAGSANYFCWTICYGPQTNVSPSAMTVNANDYNDNFHGYYDPAMNPGESTVTYVFFNTANVNDSVWFTVNYSTTGIPDTLSDPYIDVNFSAAGIADNANIVAGHAYPNPASDVVYFDMGKTGKTDKIEVFNMLGEKMYESSVSGASRIQIPVNKLPQGIYFCNFYKQGKVLSAERFTVVH